MDISLGLAFVAGLLSFLSPCVLPLVPAYVGYLGGRVTQTVAAQTAGGPITSLQITDRLSTFLHGLAFVAGFTLVFVSLGLATTAFVRLIGGQNIRLFTDLIGRVGGVFLVFLGLHIMGAIPVLTRRFRANETLLNNSLLVVAFAVVGSLLILWAFVEWWIALPVLAMFILWLFLSDAFTKPGTFWTQSLNRIDTWLYADTRRQMNAGSHGYLSSLFMGVVFSAGWTPCIGPIYGGILTMAASGGSVSTAGAQLMAYSLGLGIPFLAAALMMDGAQGALRRVQRHMRKIKLVSGALLLIIGIAVATGSVQELSRDFAQQFADFSYQLENCGLSIVQGERPLGEFGACMQGTGEPVATS